MKQVNFMDDDKTKADYKNWVPASLLKNLIFASLAAFILFIAFGVSDFVFSGRTRLIYCPYSWACNVDTYFLCKLDEIFI